MYFTVADGREDKLLPVLVFIHGEDFGYGSGNPYDPSMLVSQGNIVAVTLNYRLGILGKMLLFISFHFLHLRAFCRNSSVVRGKLANLAFDEK